MTHKTHRSCLGEYTRTDGERTVTITYHDGMRGWIAAADWDRHWYTDPLDTKREAVVNADYMLREASNVTA